MADGPYRFHQPGAGPFSVQQAQSQQRQTQQPYFTALEADSPALVNYGGKSPSPPQSPAAPVSLGNSPFYPYAMYSQGHQGQHAAMLNGSQAPQRFAMQLPKFQHQNHHPHHAQQHPHHPHLNQAAHQLNQHNFAAASALAAASTPHYTPAHLQNGTPAAVEDDIDETAMSEHWQQQLQLAAESRQASSPHYYARTVAQQSKGIQLIPVSQADQSDGAGDKQGGGASKDGSRQGWKALDFGGQGLRALSPPLFQYQFLNKLYLNHNKLKTLPPAIGQLRNLVHLDVSSNEISELPPEIGMLTNLRTFYLFDNHLHTLPYEMGYLYRLETLGIQGNPLNEVLKSQIIKDGTRALITYLKENMPGGFFPWDL